ncbi:hypothetical protein [Pseudomonas aeruginosa]|uniref:hypothetical protein n=1 Tax=Pseudomonas aeruginosa TaxID=287 RepID=UPI0021A8C8F7|nr:hypothetical protein [Pseudomonas aeruginosa]UWU64909.1 hypothetical protein NDR95_13405 [Pseudomonas aeruginosa]
MSNIRNVQWNEGAPDEILPGMLLLWEDTDGSIYLVGHEHDICDEESQYIARWAWLIQPHEFAWLEDMANKHKARARG